MSANHLPTGWAVVPLKRVAEVQLGKMLDKAKNTGELRPYLRNTNVRWAGFDLSDVAQIRMSEAEAEKFSIRDGDLLVCEGGEPGRCSVWSSGQTNLTYQKALHRVRVSSALNPWILGWQLRLDTLTGALTQQFTGSTIKHLPQIVLQKYEVLVPPRAEQQRIADKLDTVLSRVDACRDRLARVAPLLKRFRQSVLAASASGRLTADWRANSRAAHVRGKRTIAVDQNAPAIEQWLNSLPSAWGVLRASEVVEPGADIVYGIVQPGPKLASGVPYVRGLDIVDGQIQVGQLLRTSPAIAAKYGRAAITGGDVLLGIIRATKVAVVPAELDGANITQGTARLRPSALVLPDYLAAVLRAPATQRWLHAHYRGIDMPGLNLADVRRTPVPIPSKEEQVEIVQRLGALLGYADRLEARVAAAHAAVERLTPALLAKAFRGELVPQDAADEPAAELLKRLAAGREGAPISRAGLQRVAA